MRKQVGWRETQNTIVFVQMHKIDFFMYVQKPRGDFHTFFKP